MERQGSLWNSSPADWFADINSGIQDSGLQKTWEDAAAAMGPLPESLGKVILLPRAITSSLKEGFSPIFTVPAIVVSFK